MGGRCTAQVWPLTPRTVSDFVENLNQVSYSYSVKRYSYSYSARWIERNVALLPLEKVITSIGDESEPPWPWLTIAIRVRVPFH